LQKCGTGQINTSGVVDVMARACIYYGKLHGRYSRDKDNNMIVLPSLIPSFTISDPTTCEFTKLYEEYSGDSDAIQFMHPLMYEDLGRYFGSFNTQRIKRPLSCLLHFEAMARWTDSSKEICYRCLYLKQMKLGGV
jgi:hypothetical protein